MSAATILEHAAALAAERKAEHLRPYAPLMLKVDEVDYLEKMRRLGGFQTRTAFIRSLVREIIKDDKAAEGK